LLARFGHKRALRNLEMKSRVAMLTPILLAASLALGACGQSAANSIDQIDNELIANDADPALTSALEDQILVDPALTQQANRHSVRPAEAPMQAQYPLDSGPARARPASAATGRMHAANAGEAQRCASCEAGGAAGSCGADLQHSLDWANRLPAAFPPYPGGRLTDAAGSDASACRVRVVTFRTGDAPARVIGWYQQKAVAAGFSAEQQTRGADLVLGGVQGEGAYYLIVTPVEGGSEVALIVNQGS
jgi:hypothetical protein